MRIKQVAVVALTAAMTVVVGGCEDATGEQPGTPASSVGTPNEPTRSGQVDQPSEPSPDTTIATEQPTSHPAPSTSNPAPYGSGHGLCFDLNSQLAAEGLSQLAPVSTGEWTIVNASEDPISDGCDGTLSWMYAIAGGNHPYQHVLFFTGGTCLGTATAKPYGYTKVLGKSENTTQVQYRWLNPGDALANPTGGPSVVTFTLTGGRVQANGQFPPDN
ncbi:LppP/LprE family lipoprotein [Nocardia uniformis]|uniref:LppP/LprE family lipoprotein n=1 Tax=Nocardia uniformis TaxID=53432 RepID=A0A849CFZ5_9NOCA|nr:LppP/LprE family lipoprotein [Nocardia uniformis]NNH75725.1 LppP/LprE family lipoprotein [Nocardia uniformis]